MRKFKIFVSSVQKELKEERRAIKDFVNDDVLLSEYFDVFLFEDAPAKSKSAEATYLEEVSKSDIYMGILGCKYAGIGKNEISPTEAEFNEARKSHKTILFYIKGENGSNDQKRDAGVLKMLGVIRDPKSGYSYRRFNDITGLTDHVYDSLISFLKDKGIIGRANFEQRICEGAEITDIDESKIRWFLQTAKAKRNFPINSNSPILNCLIHLKLLREGRLTNAAILLFGKEPGRFFNQASIKCIYIPSRVVEKPFTSYQIYDGNLFDQADKAVNFVLDSIKIPVVQQQNTVQASRMPEIPIFAIHEAIVNALAHRLCQA